MNSSLLTLLAQLKDCPSHTPNVSRELFIAGWDDLVREDVTPLRSPTLPIMSALLLSHERFTGLLTSVEQSQLQSLVQLALDRYEQQTNPPNQLGKLIAGVTALRPPL